MPFDIMVVVLVLYCLFATVVLLRDFFKGETMPRVGCERCALRSWFLYPVDGEWLCGTCMNKVRR